MRLIIRSMEAQEFEQIMRRIRPTLLKSALRLTTTEADAEDAVQDILCKLWSIRKQLDRYTCIDRLALTALRNHCLSQLRKTRYEVPWQENLYDAADESIPAVEKDEGLQMLLRIIARLPDTQQIVLRMKHIDGLEIEEIARTLGCTVEAVRVNLSRARHRVKAQFDRLRNS